MREVLLVSQDTQLIQSLVWYLEAEGFVVEVSSSLENSFLEVGKLEPYLVIVDSDSLADEWAAKRYLSWFHRRSPVVLLGSLTEEGLMSESDCCLPRAVDRERLLNCIHRLRAY